MIHRSLYIDSSGARGRGVFTREAIPGWTLVEEAPVVAMSADERRLLDQTRLHDYIFEWNPGGVPGCCMALGWVPVYNHGAPSNCEHVMDYETGTIRIVSIRDIEAGEELTINYTGDAESTLPVWFVER